MKNKAEIQTQDKPKTPVADDFKLAIEFEDFVSSLENACANAGGAFDWDRFKRMTVQELMELLAPNKVRFTYEVKAVADYGQWLVAVHARLGDAMACRARRVNDVKPK